MIAATGPSERPPLAGSRTGPARAGRASCLGLLLLALTLGRVGACWGDAPAASPSPSPPPSAPVSSINTNRPTQGTNTGVVGPGVVEVEFGANSTSFKGGGPALYQLQMQLRVGLTEHTEINFTNPLFNTQGSASGVGDTNVAFKWQFATQQCRCGTAVFALVPNVTIPMGAAAFRNPGAIYQLILSADVPVGKSGQNLTLNLAPSTLVDGAKGKRFVQVFGAAYYTFPVNDTTSAFVETSAFGLDRSVGGAFLPSVDAGIQWILATDNAVDIDILKGLGSRGTDWFVTVGFSHRFR